MPDEVKKTPEKAPLTTALRKQLEAEKKRLEAELAPHRVFHDAHVNDPQFLESKAKIKEINAALFPVLNELAALARAGGAKSIVAEAGEYSTAAE